MKTRGRPDFLLLVFTIVLVGLGLVMVYSSSSVYALYKNADDLLYLKKQLMWAGIGIVAMFIFMNIPYTFFKKHFVKIMIFSLLLLIAVNIPGIGSIRNGARSWIILGPLSLQPSEFAKLAIIIYLSALITKKENDFRDLSKGFLPAIIISGLFFVLIAISDLGSALILIVTSMMVIYAGGANLKHMGTLALVLLGLVTVFIVTSSYRIDRFLQGFKSPWEDGLGGLGTGFQLIHSYFAFAHGGFSGAGFGQSIEKYLYLPEAQTDFIFAIFAEELGYIGVVMLILFYLFFLWRILTVTFRVKDLFANLLGVGIVCMIFVQALFNMGGVTGILPITGVPLPFMSYGGSSLLLNLMSLGIVLSISREYSKLKIQKMLKEATEKA